MKFLFAKRKVEQINGDYNTIRCNVDCHLTRTVTRSFPITETKIAPPPADLGTNNRTYIHKAKPKDAVVLNGTKGFNNLKFKKFLKKNIKKKEN